MLIAIIILSFIVFLLILWIAVLQFNLNNLKKGLHIINNNQVIFQGDIQKIAQIIEHNAKVVNEIINIKNKTVMPFIGPMGEA